MSSGVALEQGEAGEQGRARGRSSKEDVPETSSCGKKISALKHLVLLCVFLPGTQGQPSYCPAQLIQLMEATFCLTHRSATKLEFFADILS